VLSRAPGLTISRASPLLCPANGAEFRLEAQDAISEFSKLKDNSFA
jgi:hypothetical protein